MFNTVASAILAGGSFLFPLAYEDPHPVDWAAFDERGTLIRTNASIHVASVHAHFVSGLL